MTEPVLTIPDVLVVRRPQPEQHCLPPLKCWSGRDQVTGEPPGGPGDQASPNRVFRHAPSQVSRRRRSGTCLGRRSTGR
jgi:hypothetical protein